MPAASSRNVRLPGNSKPRQHSRHAAIMALFGVPLVGWMRARKTGMAPCRAIANRKRLNTRNTAFNDLASANNRHDGDTDGAETPHEKRAPRRGSARG